MKCEEDMKRSVLKYCAHWWAHKKIYFKLRFERTVFGALLSRGAFRLRMRRASLSEDEFDPSLGLFVNLVGCHSREEEERRIREIMRHRQRLHERGLAKTDSNLLGV